MMGGRLAIILVCTLLPVGFAFAGPVLVVASDQRGQGLARTNGTECFVVAPRHIFKNVRNPRFRLEITGPDNARGLAEVTQRVVGREEDDIALLRVVDNGGRICSEREAAELKRQGTSIALRTGEGGLTFTDVRITSTGGNRLGVVSANEFSPLMQGMSGGLLIDNGKARGLLIKVPTQSMQGKEAEVRSLDYIAGLVGAWVQGPASDTRQLVNALEILEKAMTVRPTGDIGHIAAAEQLVRQGSDLSGFDLHGLSFKSAALGSAEMSDTNLDATALEHANFERANLSGSTIRFANMTMASLAGATLEGAHAAYVNAADLRLVGANGQRSAWVLSKMRNADFSGADLRRARFMFTDLSGANFSDAKLNHALFIGSDLTGATFAGAVFENTDMTMTVGSSSQLSVAQREQICARAIGRERISLLQVDDGRYDTVFEEYLYPGGSLHALKECRLSVPSGSEPGWPLYSYSNKETISIYYPVSFERQFLQKFGRRNKFRNLVRERLDWLLALWKDGSFLTVQSTASTALLSTLEHNARSSRTRSGELFVSASEYVLPLLLLKYNPSLLEDYEWLFAARDWAGRQDDFMRADMIELGKYNSWSRFFPPGVGPQMIGEPQAEMFKLWTENRARDMPSILTLRTGHVPQTTQRKIARGADTFAPLAGFRARAPRGSESLDPAALRTYKMNTGMYVGGQSLAGYLRFSHDLDLYQLTISNEVRKSMGGLREFEARFRVTDVVTEPGRNELNVIFHSELVDLRAIGKDGTIYPQAPEFSVADSAIIDGPKILTPLNLGKQSATNSATAVRALDSQIARCKAISFVELRAKCLGNVCDMMRQMNAVDEATRCDRQVDELEKAAHDGGST